MRVGSHRIHAWVWCSVAGVALLLYGVTWVGRDRNIWQGWEGSRELRMPAYAERIHAAQVFRTRANTWSNLAYVVVGFYAIAFALRDLRTGGKLPPADAEASVAFGLTFGTACCVLGIGSGLFHASLTRFGHHLDVASMYPPLISLVALSLARRVPTVRIGQRVRHTWPLFVFGVILLGGVLYHFKWVMSSTMVLGTLIAAVSITSVTDRLMSAERFNAGWLVGSLLALVAAIVCRQLDVAGRFSSPDSWAQGHAFWHLLTAVGLALAYVFHARRVDVPLES